MNARSTSAAGILLAASAYGIWGLFPAFWKLLSHVPPLDVLAHRILWSVLFAALALVANAGRRAALRAVLSSRRALLALTASGAAISVNWGTFIWAVTHGRVLESSLGYFLNPLVVVALGVVVLGERLRPLQWLAVALAAAGVAVLAWRSGGLPWVALTLAVSFALYGLARKTTPLEPVTGLAVETALMVPPALAYLLLRDGPIMPEPATMALLSAGGLLTAVPLVLFGAAALRLPFTTLGFFQYIAPTGHFLLAVLVYGEHVTAGHAVTFGCIWVALALYLFDTWRQMPSRTAIKV